MNSLIFVDYTKTVTKILSDLLTMTTLTNIEAFSSTRVKSLS